MSYLSGLINVSSESGGRYNYFLSFSPQTRSIARCALKLNESDRKDILFPYLSLSVLSNTEEISVFPSRCGPSLEAAVIRVKDRGSGLTDAHKTLPHAAFMVSSER